MKKLLFCVVIVLCASCISRKSDVAVITDFYKAVLGEKEMTDKILKKSLSTKVLETLWEADYEDTYSWWNFRTGVQDGPSNESFLESIEPLGEGWYRVSYSDLGIRGVTDVKMEKGRIVDYRPSIIIQSSNFSGTLDGPLPAAPIAEKVLAVASAGPRESAPERVLEAMEYAVRQPKASYDSATGTVWLATSAMQGTGVAVEWLYQIRFDGDGKAYVACTVDPYVIQQMLCQRMAYSIDGQKVTLYDGGRIVADATNTVSDMGGFDDEQPLWIGEQLQYDLSGPSPCLLVTPGLKFTTGLVLTYDDMPTLSAPLTISDDGSLSIGELETAIL